MMDIVIIVICGINLIISSVALILQIKNNSIGNVKSSDNAGNVYCSNCCQPFPANLKNCPKCGQPKKMSH